MWSSSGSSVSAARAASIGIVGVEAAIGDPLADGAIEEAGVEIGQAEMAGEPRRERALAGRRRSVDGDDHGARRDDPRPLPKADLFEARAKAGHHGAELGEAGRDRRARRRR